MMNLIGHWHECRDCGLGIPSGKACDNTQDDGICGWEGGNNGCDCGFEARALEIATYNPPHAIEGWAGGAGANGLTKDAALYERALAIQEEWRA